MKKILEKIGGGFLVILLTIFIACDFIGSTWALVFSFLNVIAVTSMPWSYVFLPLLIGIAGTVIVGLIAFIIVMFAIVVD